MTQPTTPSRLDSSERLKSIMSERKGRIESTLNWAIGVGENLHSRFDDISSKELKVLQEQLDILEHVGEDMRKERRILEGLTKQVDEAYNELGEMLESAKRGEITSFIDCLPSIIKGFQTLGKLQELVEDVDRWSRSFTRNVDTMLELIDRRLRDMG